MGKQLKVKIKSSWGYVTIKETIDNLLKKTFNKSLQFYITLVLRKLKFLPFLFFRCFGDILTSSIEPIEDDGE
jgi:hypothetical protein